MESNHERGGEKKKKKEKGESISIYFDDNKAPITQAKGKEECRRKGKNEMRQLRGLFKKSAQISHRKTTKYNIKVISLAKSRTRNTK